MSMFVLIFLHFFSFLFALAPKYELNRNHKHKTIISNKDFDYNHLISNIFKDENISLDNYKSEYILQLIRFLIFFKDTKG